MFFAIPLFEGPTMLDRHTNQETETVKPESGRKAVAFRPVVVFAIAQHDNTRFGPKGHQLFILSHSRFLDIVHLDIAFGVRYALILVDRTTGYNWVYGLKDLSADSMLLVLRNFKADARSYA